MQTLIHMDILAIEFPSDGFDQNVLIFGVDMSFSAHIDNKKRHFNSWKRTNTRIRTF